MEWVAQNLESHLRGGGIVGGNPDEDYGLERESVMHGDYAEESKDPHTQESDPYNTEEPEYTEYADPLSKILKIAGVPDKVHSAPNYETGDLEEERIDEFLPALAAGAEIAADALGGAELAGAAGEAGAEAGGIGAAAMGGTGNNSSDNSDSGLKDVRQSLEKFTGTATTDEDAESPLKGKYGHSGKLKPVAKDVSFLDRLKELSGMVRN